MIYKQTLTQTLAAGTLTTEFYNPTPTEVDDFIGTTPLPGDPPPVIDDFPEDPYDAPFPSPVKSSIPNKPYLRDITGGIFEMVGTPTVVSVNGTGQNSPGDYNQLIMDGKGRVWARGAAGDLTGNWYVYGSHQFDLDNAGPSFEPPAPIAAPPDPPRAAIAPGSSGRIVSAFTTIESAVLAAQDGDTIQLEARTYTESVVINKAVRIKGIPGGGTKIDGTGLTYKMQGRGCMIPTTDTIWEDIEFVGTGMADTTSNLTSAIRPTGGWLECNWCKFNDNQCGIGTDGAGNNNVVTLNDCEFQRNGLTDGRSHNIYLGKSTVRLEFKNLISGSPTDGHALKSRAWDVVGDGGTFDSAHAAPIELGFGGTFSLKNITINKAAGDDNHKVFSYAVDGALNGSAGGAITGTINALCINPQTQVKEGTVDMTGVTWTGTRPVTNEGAGTVTGLPT